MLAVAVLAVVNLLSLCLLWLYLLSAVLAMGVLTMRVLTIAVLPMAVLTAVGRTYYGCISYGCTLLTMPDSLQRHVLTMASLLTTASLLIVPIGDRRVVSLVVSDGLAVGRLGLRAGCTRCQVRSQRE